MFNPALLEDVSGFDKTGFALVLAGATSYDIYNMVQRPGH